MDSGSEDKKESRGAWTLKELLQPIGWGDSLGILFWGVHVVGYLLIAMFVVDIVRFYVFHGGVLIWSRELVVLVLGIMFVVGTNYYAIRKKKHRKVSEGTEKPNISQE